MCSHLPKSTHSFGSCRPYCSGKPGPGIANLKNIPQNKNDIECKDICKAVSDMEKVKGVSI